MAREVYYKVINVPHTYYHTLRIGDVGKMADERSFGGKIALSFDRVQNRHSSYGWFYLSVQCLERIKGDQIEMTAAPKLGGNYRVALVSFIEGSNTNTRYMYACYDDTLTVSDICVVKSAHHGFGIARIVEFIENDGSDICREIVCKADFTAYNERMTKRATEEEIIRKMRSRAEELKEITLYETLAKADPEMACLLTKYKDIWR